VQAFFIELAWKINKNERKRKQILHFSVFRIKKGEKELNFFEGRAIIIVTVTFSKLGEENRFLLLILCTQLELGEKTRKRCDT